LNRRSAGKKGTESGTEPVKQDDESKKDEDNVKIKKENGEAESLTSTDGKKESEAEKSKDDFGKASRFRLEVTAATCLDLVFI